MANMREIRTRMNSVNEIMKITNAMYLISSSKFRFVVIIFCIVLLLIFAFVLLQTRTLFAIS